MKSAPLFLALFALLLLAGCTEADQQRILKFVGLAQDIEDEAFDVPPTSPADRGGPDAVTGPTPLAPKALYTPGTYTRFDRRGFEAAKRDGKVVFLEFTANWCPICKEQEPKIVDAFRQLKAGNNQSVVGYFAHFNDNETTEDERLLARNYNVISQHTHLFFDERGEVYLRSLDLLEANEILANLRMVTG